MGGIKFIKMDDEIIKKFSEENLVLSSEGMEKIRESKLEVEGVIAKAKEKGEWLITPEFLDTFFIKEELTGERVEVLRRTSDIPAKEIESRLTIYQETDVTGKSTSSGKLEDFLEYFTQKYENLRGVLRERGHLAGEVPIKVVKKYSEEATVIGMVRDKRESRRGYKFLEVEDPTGELTVLIPKDNDHLQGIYDEIMLDEVVAIAGVVRKDLFIAREILEPELPVSHQTNWTQDAVNMVLLSDIHVGSNLFLEREFSEFLEWLNLKRGKEDVAGKVKYLVVAGDLVDGIGIYPQQERDLIIPDIYGQYDALAGLIEQIPSWIEVILSVGNHDAVRRAEPQPKLDKDLAGRLGEMPHVHLVGNPVWLETHGVRTLVYHGTSLDTMISSSANYTYSRPERAMVGYLKKRYLVPSYGNDIISPDRDNFLFIKEIPDIFHCGHIHTNGYSNYRGVTVINSGTFQGRTEYQEQQGHEPTPCKVPIINLQSGEVSVIDFSRGEV